MSYAVNEKTIVKLERRRVPQPRHAERLAAARRQSAVPAPGERQQRQQWTTPAAPVAQPSLPFGMTAIDQVFKHPTAYTYSAGVQRETALELHRRRGLRRPPRPLPAARAQHQSAAGRARSRRTPASTPTALRPYKGYGVIRLSENAGYSKYNSLQLGVDRRYTNGFKFGAGVHARQVGGQRERQADVLFNTFDDSGYWGQLELRPPPRVRTSTTSTTCRSSKEQNSLVSRILGGWQISGSTFMRIGHAAVGDEHDGRRRRRRRLRQAVQPGQRSERRTPIRRSHRALPAARPSTRTSGSIPTPSCGRPRARSATGRGTASTTRASTSGTSRCSRTSRIAGNAVVPVPRGDLQLPQSREPERREQRPDERHVRSRDRQGRLASRHSAQYPVLVLTVVSSQ